MNPLEWAQQGSGPTGPNKWMGPTGSGPLTGRIGNPLTGLIRFGRRIFNAGTLLLFFGCFSDLAPKWLGMPQMWLSWMINTPRHPTVASKPILEHFCLTEYQNHWNIQGPNTDWFLTTVSGKFNLIWHLRPIRKVENDRTLTLFQSVFAIWRGQIDFALFLSWI